MVWWCGCCNGVPDSEEPSDRPKLIVQYARHPKRFSDMAIPITISPTVIIASETAFTMQVSNEPKEEPKPMTTYLPAQKPAFTVDWLKPKRAQYRPVVKAGKLTGRNDPCPCRSGKKFKKCCSLRRV